MSSVMPFPFSRRLRHATWSCAAAVALLACSPVFNWRETPIPGGELVALLPCKPDRAERQLPLGSQTVRVDMAGCAAGGATFAVAHANAADPPQAEDWMKAWRVQAYAQWAGGRVEESPGQVPHAASLPAPLRLDASRSDAPASDPARTAHLLWFAHRNRDGTVALYQATVLGQPSASEAIDNFFAGLRLPG